MYYIFVDIHHVAQLNKLESQLMGEITGGIDEICSRYGMNRSNQIEGLLYAHTNLGAGEYEPLLKALFQIFELLENHSEKLSGFSVILEAEDVNDGNSEEITALSLRLRERQGMYLGNNAEKLISRFLIGESYRGLWKVFGRKQKDDENLGTATEFSLNKSLLSKILDALEPWMNGEKAPGVVSVSGTEYDGIHLIGRGVANRLVSIESQGKLPFIYVRDDLYFSLASTISIHQLDWVQDELTELEQQIWEHTRHSLHVVHPDNRITADRYDIVPEQLESELQLAMQVYLRAYSRWSRNNGNSPLVIIHLEKQLSEAEKLFLYWLMEDRENKLFWMFTGERSCLPEGELPLDHWSFELETYDEAAIHRMLQRRHEDIDESHLGYISRSTAGAAIPLFQFLSDYSYFSDILPSRLRNYGNAVISPQEGIVQRYLDRLDQESRELLFLLEFAGSFLDKEQLFAFMESRGRTRIRITQIYKDLQARGLLMYEQSNAVVFRQCIQRMSYSLGELRKSIVADFCAFIVANTNSPAVHPGLLRLIAEHDQSSDTLRWLYRRVQCFLESGQLERAGKLFDIFSGSREKAWALNLLESQLSYHRLGKDRPFYEDSDEIPTFWKAERLVTTARWQLRSHDIDAARNSSKHAIIEYQNIQDNYGLSQANILFGFLLLKNGKHQDAHHYFSIAGRGSSVITRDVNLIMAEFLPSLSDFAEGRLSRVRAVLEGDDGLVARLYRNGSRWWSTAASFLLARTYFSMGLFLDSYKLLSQNLNSLRGEEFAAIRPVILSWMGRSLIYAGNDQAGLKILTSLEQCNEARVFIAEAQILSEDFNTVIQTLDEPVPDVREVYGNSGLLPWSSGFSWIEDIFVIDSNQDGVLSMYRHAIRAYAFGNINEIDESIRLFHWLTREKKIPGSDPHLSVILYWYSRILEKARDGENEDRLTLLGRAVKALQERSSRIDEPADKREFLKNVRWNRELLDKAKRFNLV